MKKISSIIAIALCLVVGGVFSTWIYVTGGTAAPDSTTFTIGLEAKQDQPAGEIGTISITPNAPVIKIDNVNGDYKIALTGSGSFTVKFTPNAGANTEIKENGIALQYSITGPEGASPNNFTYESTPIFASVDSAQQSIEAGATVLTATIQVTDIIKLITLGNITLDTSAKYDAFQTALGTPTFTLNVSQVPA